MVTYFFLLLVNIAQEGCWEPELVRYSEKTVGIGKRFVIFDESV